VVASVDRVGKILCFVLVCTGVNSKKDLWRLFVCVEDSYRERKESIRLRGEERTILRPRGRAEPAEVGVLHQKSTVKFKIFTMQVLSESQNPSNYDLLNNFFLQKGFE
jgi:hypothetical protein